ncbi:hypothetical protein S83_066144 [Arachis hypogaea]
MASNVNNGGNNTGSKTVGGGASEKIAKNTPENRSDKAWKHEISIDGDAKKIKCKYCDKVVTGGVYRLKHHLAGTKKNVELCIGVSDEVKREMFDIVVGLQKKLVKTRDFEKKIQSKDEGVEEEGDALVGEKIKEKEIETPTSLFKKRGVSTQTTINSIFKKGLKEEACDEITSFIYNNAIPFNVARSEEYHSMFEKVAHHGLGFKPPSYDELRGKLLKKKVESTKLILEEYKAE